MNTATQYKETQSNFRYSSGKIDKHVVFFIEIYGESSAYYLAARLQKENWEVNLLPVGSRLVLHAHAVVALEHETMSELCDYLADVSESYGGIFKKWELA